MDGESSIVGLRLIQFVMRAGLGHDYECNNTIVLLCVYNRRHL
jgi:hypothetical protein